jgi:hypothetical protein
VSESVFDPILGELSPWQAKMLTAWDRQTKPSRVDRMKLFEDNKAKLLEYIESKRVVVQRKDIANRFPGMDTSEVRAMIDALVAEGKIRKVDAGAGHRAKAGYERCLLEKLEK